MKQNIVGFVVKQIGIGVLFLILIAINLGCGFLYMVFDAMTDPRGTMAAREEKIRENVIPALLERNGLDACPVKCLPKDDSARFRIEVADPSRYEAIAEDVFRLERTIRSVRTNQVYILEFDHDSETRGLTVGFFTPDAINDPPQGWRTPALWINTGE
jgi:hypothetical protein